MLRTIRLQTMVISLAMLMVCTLTIPAHAADSIKAGKLYKAGDRVKTKKGVKFTIIELAGEGRRGRVYRVKNDAGKIFALKIAVDTSSDTLDSFKKESIKTDGLAKIKAPHASIKEHDKIYVVKAFIEGKRSDTWFKEWVDKGAKIDDPNFKSLIELFRFIAKQKKYVGDLNRKNLILSNGRWFIIDGGRVRDAKPDKSFRQFMDKMAKWGTKMPGCSPLKYSDALNRMQL